MMTLIFAMTKVLTHLRQMLLSNRHQPFGLHCKSIAWFLNDGNIGRQKGNGEG